MDVGRRLLTVNEGDNMRVVQALEDVDFRIKILFQLLVQLLQFDRLDSDMVGLLLLRHNTVSHPITRTLENIDKTSPSPSSFISRTGHPQ